MHSVYIKSLELVTDQAESGFMMQQKRTCYNGIYPFKIFPQKLLTEIRFNPITIFYGGNGSGKSTLLNIIAEKTQVLRHSAFSGGAFFGEYVTRVKMNNKVIPPTSQTPSSAEVFD